MKSKTKNKLIVDKYINPIFFPNDLYIVKNYTERDIKRLFDIGDRNIEEGSFDAMALSGVTFKKTKDNCFLILLDTRILKDKEPFYCEGVAVHEASHYTHFILEYCGIPLTKDTTEVYAYLTEWATKCVLNTLTK